MVTDHQETTTADPEPTTEALVKAKKTVNMAVVDLDPIDLTTEVWAVKAKKTVVMVLVEEVVAVNVDVDEVVPPSSTRTVNRDNLVRSRLLNELGPHFKLLSEEITQLLSIKSRENYRSKLYNNNNLVVYL